MTEERWPDAIWIRVENLEIGDRVITALDNRSMFGQVYEIEDTGDRIYEVCLKGGMHDSLDLPGEAMVLILNPRR